LGIAAAALSPRARAATDPSDGNAPLFLPASPSS
jgi:hypothetical protein